MKTAMKFTRNKLYLCALACVVTSILLHLLPVYIPGYSDVCTASIFGDGCMKKSWMEIQLDKPKPTKLVSKFKAIQRCWIDSDKCGFGDWQLPFETFIDNTELLITDVIRFFITYIGSLYSLLSELTMFNMIFNIWTCGITFFYLFTYSALLPLRNYLFDQLMLNKQQPYTFKTSLIFDGKTVTILERGKV